MHPQSHILLGLVMPHLVLIGSQGRVLMSVPQTPYIALRAKGVLEGCSLLSSVLIYSRRLVLPTLDNDSV